jgi:hypothetical protein
MTETLTNCPTALIEAPVQRVWQLLTDPETWPSFYDLRVMRIEPPGLATAGQRVFGESGPRWLHLAVTLTFTAVDASQGKLELIVQLPLGIVVTEELGCKAINATQCRVSYHCHFALPSGWHGWLLRMVLWRELRVGPEDSLRRLKQAAEQRSAVTASSVG